MNITLALNIFRWRIGTFDVHIAVDQQGGLQPFTDRSVKGVSRWWVRRMTE